MRHWLDDVIEEQRRIQGPAATKLITAAAEAEEKFTLNELERHARANFSPADRTAEGTDHEDIHS